MQLMAAGETEVQCWRRRSLSVHPSAPASRPRHHQARTEDWAASSRSARYNGTSLRAHSNERGLDIARRFTEEAARHSTKCERAARATI